MVARLKLILESFDQYKSSVPDGIFPALVQKDIEMIEIYSFHNTGSPSIREPRKSGPWGHGHEAHELHMISTQKDRKVC